MSVYREPSTRRPRGSSGASRGMEIGAWRPCCGASASFMKFAAPRVSEHASALACCLESHAARSQDFDPVPCLLQLLAKEATSKIAANALCAWLSNVPAARLKFRDLRRLGPFLSSSTTADAICQAASCVLRDAACAIPNGDAASLIGPLAALCEKAVRAVTERAAQRWRRRARLALAQRSHDISDAPRLLAHAMVALWSAARAAVDGGPPDEVRALLATHADEVARVCLAPSRRGPRRTSWR